MVFTNTGKYGSLNLDNGCVSPFEIWVVNILYCCALYARSKGIIHGRCVVGHILRELSRFCKYFLDYSGVIDATVTSVDFRRSTIPQGGLENPVNLHIIRSASSHDVFKKMKIKVEQYYQEPNNILDYAKCRYR